MNKLILIILLLTSAAQAATKVDVVAAVGPNGFTCEQTLKMFRDSLYAYDAIGVKFKIIKESCMINPYPGDLDNRFTNWFKWSKKLKHRKRKTIVITNPLHDGGLTWIAGLGSYPMQLAIVYAQPKNTNGDDRYYMSMTATQHETGHVKGADHDEAPDQIMHPNALFYTLTNPDLKFSSQSIKEFKSWRARKKYWGRARRFEVLTAIN